MTKLPATATQQRQSSLPSAAPHSTATRTAKSDNGLLSSAASPPRRSSVSSVLVAQVGGLSANSLQVASTVPSPGPSPSTAFFAAELAAAAAVSANASTSPNKRKDQVAANLSSSTLPYQSDYPMDVYANRPPPSPAASTSSALAMSKSSSTNVTINSIDNNRHQRLQSLTTACLPVTANYSPAKDALMNATSPDSPSKTNHHGAASSYLVPGTAGFGLGLINSNEPYPSPSSSASSPQLGSVMPSRSPSPYADSRPSIGSSLSARAAAPPPINVSSASPDQFYSRSPVLGSALTMSTPDGTGGDEPPVYTLNSGPLLVPSSVGYSGKRSSISSGLKGFGWGMGEEKPSTTPDIPKGLKKPPRSTTDYGSGTSGRRSILSWPLAILHFLLGPFSILTVSTPGVKDGSPGRTASSGPLWLRLLGVGYVALSVVIFTKACAGSIWGNNGSEGWVDRRRGEGVAGAKQVVLAGAASAWGRLESWRGSNVPIEPIEPWDMEDAVRRKWDEGALAPEEGPLSTLGNTYRFSKVHSKMASAYADDIEPYLFPATGGSLSAPKGVVTACMYTNDIWAPEMPGFVKRWGGPVSLVWETMAARNDSKARSEVMKRISKMRESDSTFRALVDVHLVSTAAIISNESLDRRRERMLVDPTASNAQLNVARMFARTAIVWMIGDSRFIPSHNLRLKLNGEGLKRQILEKGDAMVVPSFGWIRPKGSIKTPTELREQHSTTALKDIEQMYVSSHRETLPLVGDKWPKTKRGVVGLTSSTPTLPITENGETTNVAVATPESGPLLMLHDKSWDLGKGPSNWALWRKSATDPRLAELPELGGGSGLGTSGGVGGGNALYRVIAYDLHYSPSVVVSKEGQPWCTERFERNGAACTYQMYLAGTELWVIPDAWAFTLQSMEKPSRDETSESEKLKNSISTRLYTKFHQEACMHYGREFLSIEAWSGSRARHLRIMCSTVLRSWGVGVTQEPGDVVIIPPPPPPSTLQTTSSTLPTSLVTSSLEVNHVVNL